MRTKDCNPDQIQPYVAYFKDLKANNLDFLDREGIPVEAYEMLAAKKILPVAASARKAEKANAPAPIDIPEGLSVFICEVPPGNGPALHAHMQTRETFMCLSGRLRVRYGREGQHSIDLGPMDTVSVPEGVMRAFENQGDGTAYLLVLIHENEKAQALNDVYFSPETGDEIAARFGKETLDAFDRIGTSFTADIEDYEAARAAE